MEPEKFCWCLPPQSTMAGSPSVRPSVFKDDVHFSEKSHADKVDVLGVNSAEQKRILRKLDWWALQDCLCCILNRCCRHLLPFVTLLYLLSFLWADKIFQFWMRLLMWFYPYPRDRSNIGNAKVAGMAKDLKLIGLKYNIAAAVFFVSIRPIPEWWIWGVWLFTLQIPYGLAEVPS